jgi:Fic-DOC domain mobile mystery protein B
VTGSSLDETDDASTPLTPEERAQLIPVHVRNRSDLNIVENKNVSEAYVWAFQRRRDVLSERFLRRLHKRMFGKVWKWAGSIRESEKNIGVETYQIRPELKILLDDANYWIRNETFSPDEIAVRFHHRMVFIHPFPNGNGRHARLAADLLITRLNAPVLSWGARKYDDPQTARSAYVSALRAADQRDIRALLDFCRS